MKGTMRNTSEIYRVRYLQTSKLTGKTVAEIFYGPYETLGGARTAITRFRSRQIDYYRNSYQIEAALGWDKVIDG